MKTVVSGKFLLSIAFLGVLIGGWFYPILGYFVPLCMLLGISLGLVRGRLWCGFICPRGSFFDVWMKPISPKKNIPAFLKSTPFRVAVLIIMMLIMFVRLVHNWPDINKIGLVFVYLLTATTIIGVILALILHQRTWCSFCPVGSMAHWISRLRFKSLDK